MGLAAVVSCELYHIVTVSFLVQWLLNKMTSMDTVVSKTKLMAVNYVRFSCQWLTVTFIYSHCLISVEKKITFQAFFRTNA